MLEIKEVPVRKEKVNEAEESFKRAKKCLFNWNPDYEQGAYHFEQAANSYRNAGSNYKQNFIESCLNAAECYEKINGYNSCAKHYEMVVSAYNNEKDKDIDKLSNYLITAGYCYRQNNQIDKSADVLSKAARLFASDNRIEQVKQCYNDAIETFVSEDRSIFSHNIINEFSEFLISKCLFRDCIELLKKQNKLFLANIDTRKNFIFKNHLKIMICFIKLKDFQNAELFLTEINKENDFFITEWGEITSNLYNVFVDKNVESIAQVLNNQCFELIEPCFGRLAKSLKETINNESQEDFDLT